MNPIAIVIRTLIPLTLFKWPLLGALLCIAADLVDWPLTNPNTDPEYAQYQRLDKMFDMYYLSIELYLVFFWKNVLARKVGFFLFAYRAVGFILFEFTGVRLLLVLFTNLFEYFYIFYLTLKKVSGKADLILAKNLVPVLVILLVFKIAQEYYAHVDFTVLSTYINADFLIGNLSFLYEGSLWLSFISGVLLIPLYFLGRITK